ncbi:MAG: helix-turn-helix transcriptional regulator [Clostridiales bacterium]|nr:helix-turn-helix transcriptional regulator [Clostridiales bacterium]
MAQVLKEEVRERIEKAATLEFFEKGFEGSSLRQIARESGITPGNLYRYFDNKEALYESIVGESYRKLNHILMKNSDNKIMINDVPSPEILDDLRSINQGKIANRVIQEVIEVFGDNRMALLILLKDDRADFVMNTRFGLLDWFKSQFTMIYGNEELAKDLAYSFTEGLIKIGMDESDRLRERLEAFVQFFYMRGLKDNE